MRAVFLSYDCVRTGFSLIFSIKCLRAQSYAATLLNTHTFLFLGFNNIYIKSFCFPLSSQEVPESTCSINNNIETTMNKPMSDGNIYIWDPSTSMYVNMCVCWSTDAQTVAG